MEYKILLSTYISESGLSLSEIEQKLKEKGYATNKAYISKLQNGKIPPAGDDINKAIADVTGGDPEELIISANIEKSPILADLINTLFDSFVDLFTTNFEYLKEVARNDPKFKNNNEENTMLKFMESEGAFREVFRAFPTKMKVALIITMIKTQNNRKFKEKLTVDRVDYTFVEAMHKEIERKKNYLIAESEEEVEYLKKCIEIYRDLKLKPNK